jgi:serine/threonine-protein kinase RsbT
MTRGARRRQPPAGGGPQGAAEALHEERRVTIESDRDILSARTHGRALAQQLGLPNGDLTLVATAISELARNIILYARRGEIVLGVIQKNGREGLAVVASDRGPGIPDVGRALDVGFSTSGSLGLGLPGVRRLMDDFEIVSRVGQGTTVRATKWKR